MLQGQIGTLELELIFLIYIVQQDLVTIKPSLKYIWTDGLQPSTSESWVISHSLHFLRKWNDLTYNFQVLWTFTPNDAGYLLLQLHFQTRLQFLVELHWPFPILTCTHTRLCCWTFHPYQGRRPSRFLRCFNTPKDRRRRPGLSLLQMQRLQPSYRFTILSNCCLSLLLPSL